MSSLWQDIRFGARSLLRSRAFTAAALLSLALGSGVTSAIFSIVRAVLLTPLPYPAPNELMLVDGRRIRGADVQEWPLSYLDFQELRTRNRVFRNVAVRTEVRSFNISVNGEPEHVNGEMVSASYFTILGARPVRGRVFTPDEDRVPSGAATAVISYDLWRRHFGADPDLDRHTLRIGGESYRVVGVMPARFLGLTDQAEVWVPIARASTLLAPRYLEQRRFRWLSAVGRLAPNVSPQRAQAELNTLSANLAKEYADSNKGLVFHVQSIVEAWYGDLRPVLLILLAAAAFVLLIACANVANLLVARGLRRQAEIAVRSALGAGAGRLTRQLLTESLLLGVSGGLLGLLLGAWTNRLLIATGSGRFRSFVEIRIDALVFAVSVGATVLCVVASGLLPAISTTHTGLSSWLRQGAKSSAAASRRRLQNLLVVVEVALAVVLLVGGGLTFRELDRLRNLDLGFRTQDLLTLRLDLTEPQYRNDERVRVLVGALADRLPRIPGVSTLAFASDIPTDEGFSTHFSLEGQSDEDQVLLRVHSVSPEYFSVLGIPVLAGRSCTVQDTADAPPVVMISRGLAQRWTGGSPIGKRLKAGQTGSDSPWLTVAGVVGDVKQRGVEGEGAPDLYACLQQMPPHSPPVLNLLVRPSRVPAGSLVIPLAQAVREVTSNLPAYDMATMDQRLDDQTSRGRFLTQLMSLFAGLALVLAVIGIYGVVSYNVSQRRREIGIRMALGADRSSILWLVVAGGSIWAMAGILIGVLLALGLGQTTAGLLAGTFRSLQPADPLIFGGAALLFFAVAVTASYVPAHRAMRYEAATTLREE